MYVACPHRIRHTDVDIRFLRKSVGSLSSRVSEHRLAAQTGGASSDATEYGPLGWVTAMKTSLDGRKAGLGFRPGLAPGFVIDDTRANANK